MENQRVNDRNYTPDIRDQNRWYCIECGAIVISELLDMHTNEHKRKGN